MKFCYPASKWSSSSKAGRLRGAFTRPASTSTFGDPRRADTFSKPTSAPAPASSSKTMPAAVSRKILEAVRDAGGTLVYVLGVGAASTAKRAEELHSEFPDVSYLSMSELFGGPLLTEFSRSLTRARVQQYQRYLSDADRMLIMLHNDPDPDAMASGLALRNILRRTKTTAIIGAIQGVTRPENLRMVNLLDIHVEPVTRRASRSSTESRWSTSSRITSVD